MTTTLSFSRRLDWDGGENRLAAVEAALRREGRPIIDLTITNPTLVGLAAPDDVLREALDRPGPSHYEPSALGLRAARLQVAFDYARRGATVPVEAIALTASSSESYAVLFKLLADPGDVVLVPEPSYPLFEYLARLEGVIPRPYRLAWDGAWRIDWDSVDAAGARAMCIVSPNNPTGSFVSAHDLARAGALAAEVGMALIVDEVFADYPLAPAREAVPVVAGATLPALTFSLGGLSKSCGLPQLKLGWIAATGPQVLVTSAFARLELILDTFLSVGTPVQLALGRLLEVGAEVRKGIGARVRDNRALLAAAVGPGSPCTLFPTEAGWSAILRLPAVLTDEEWAVRFAREDGVLVAPGYFFDLNLGASIVLGLLPDAAVFGQGVTRLLARVAAAV